LLFLFSQTKVRRFACVSGDRVALVLVVKVGAESTTTTTRRRKAFKMSVWSDCNAKQAEFGIGKLAIKAIN